MRLVCIFLLAVICNYLNGTNGDRGNLKKFWKPCFVGDEFEIENTCSDPSDSCHEKSGKDFKLVRLDGVKVKCFKNNI